MPAPGPRIIAHRGASRERPENTLAAFERAVELHADAVELDVHRSQDGVLVVHHDARLADGREINALDWREVALARVRGEPIPRLEQVFAALPIALSVHCELKGNDTVAAAVAAIAASGAGRATLHAFDHRLMAEASHVGPAIPRGVLEVSYPVEVLGAARAVDARDLWRHLEFVDEALVRAAHADGRRVIAWTVNDAAQMRRLASIGVDGICTDDVALALSTLRA